MVAPVVAREGCWVGGLTKTGFAVQCRNDSASSQAATLTVKVYKDSGRVHEVAGYTSSSEVLASARHYRGTVYVTGLSSNEKYYWSVNMVEVASPNDVTTGTEKTFSAGTLTTLPDVTQNWKIGYFGCTPHSALFFDDGAERAAALWNKALQEDFLFHFHDGDIYYPDIGITTVGYTDYAEGHFFNPTTDAAATSGAYRTNFINTYSGLTYNGANITNSMFRGHSIANASAKFKAAVPCYPMWDDHDRVVNDASDRANATGDLLTRWNTGRDTAHELYMRLNKTIIDADTDSAGVSRNFTPYSSEDAYFIVDLEPVRFIVLDCRTYRTLLTATDSASKTMLGTEQKAWLKARIDDNPYKFTVILNGIMFDGEHGWEKTKFDGWLSYSYERDEILNYIWDNGDATNTVFLVGDTHEQGVFRFSGDNDQREPIYEILCGNSGWNGSFHGFVSGLKTGATGNGGVMEAMFSGVMGYISVQHINNTLKIDLVNAKTAMSGGEREGVLWSKVYK